MTQASNTAPGYRRYFFKLTIHVVTCILFVVIDDVKRGDKMIRKDPPIEINAHGEGWHDVGYVRADIAKKRVDDCEAEKSALREHAEASAKEIARLKRLTQTLWEACAKAVELIQHDEDGTGDYWFSVPGDRTTEYVRVDIAQEVHTALKSISDLMLSMQSIGYFTNDEWASRLDAAKTALHDYEQSSLREDTG